MTTNFYKQPEMDATLVITHEATGKTDRHAFKDKNNLLYFLDAQIHFASWGVGTQMVDNLFAHNSDTWNGEKYHLEFAKNRVDFFNQVLTIGDQVAFNRPYYKGLDVGILEGFTPKGYRVSYQPYYSTTAPRETTVTFQVVKKPKSTK